MDKADLHTHLQGALETAQHVHKKLTSLMRHCHDRQSQNYVQGLLDAMAQIIEALEPESLGDAAMTQNLKRAAICNGLGFNIYGVLKRLSTVLDNNEPDRDVEMRAELRALLKHFRAKGKVR